jgi:hypothetical protein
MSGRARRIKPRACHYSASLRHIEGQLVQPTADPSSSLVDRSAARETWDRVPSRRPT